MSKFLFKMRLEKFEIEIQGNRDDASLIGRSVGDQISSLLSPAMNVVEGEADNARKGSQPTILIENTGKSKGRRRTRTSTNGGEREKSPPLDFRHDPAKYGTPNQQWKTAQKAIWLLYVVKEIANVGELSTGQIVKTFNAQFRQAKTVTSSNVSRDLGNAKLASPALVGEDTTKSPHAWFLTDEGIRSAQALIAKSLSPSAE